MAKVISTLFISADGVAEIDHDWHFPYFDENMGRAVGEDYDTADVLLIGRETYDSFAGAWPGREAAGGDDAPFARQLGDVRKVVVSRQPLELLAQLRADQGRSPRCRHLAQGRCGHQGHPHPRFDLRGPAAARRGASR
jgi:dihydrofolate reductase